MQSQPRYPYVLVGMLQAGAHAKPRQDATRTCDGVEGVDPALSSTPLSTMPRLSCRLCDRSSAMMDGSLDMARPAVLVARRGSGDQASGSSPADEVTRTHAMRRYASRTAVDLNTIPPILPFRGQMRRWVQPVQTRASGFISQDQGKKAGVEASRLQL